ncbi:ABC transporter substrate-binding protein [Protaetiibacter mangrovi]|uniref:ABC transporter substrate-binding protein n=1 Tax=Protaetiibacter mangrovi TaxID=2970926 RepID=A0ABT1ZGK1_9MICO|nr:ABC transporter substrate-binding protein [Protaetiibacter mangrovi]MCS0499833.1 ABC transporter substrate-binding protein [Protaetiibacter mangrovi]TPX02967.1 PhnD/SsuA/transferrin family substrate-binding protein [Schumannella luteola]
MSTKRMFGVAAFGAAAILALTGCTDSGAPAPAESGDASGELIPITVGVIPIADTAPLYLAQSEGFFADAGLDVTIETAAGGAAIVPAVVAGDYQFGFSNTLSLMVAQSKDIDVKMVSAAVATTGDTSSDFGAIVVKGDSPIQTAADLSGKTVSSNTLGNINDTVTRSVVDAAGGDGASVNIVEVAFPDAVAAVENGQVDAAFVVEPFVSAALAAGDRVVSYAYADFDPSLDIAAYFALGSYVSDNPDIVEKFQTAMSQALEFAQKNPDAVRDIIGTYTKTDDATRAKIVLPMFPVEINEAAQKKLAEAAVTYGALSAEPDWDSLLP